MYGRPTICFTLCVFCVWVFVLSVFCRICLSNILSLPPDFIYQNLYTFSYALRIPHQLCWRILSMLNIIKSICCRTCLSNISSLPGDIVYQNSYTFSYTLRVLHQYCWRLFSIYIDVLLLNLGTKLALWGKLHAKPFVPTHDPSSIDRILMFACWPSITNDGHEHLIYDVRWIIDGVEIIKFCDLNYTDINTDAILRADHWVNQPRIMGFNVRYI